MPPAALRGTGYRFSVRDFGARGDGTSDDTKAFQAAIAAAANATIRSDPFLPPQSHSGQQLGAPDPHDLHYVSQPVLFIPFGEHDRL